MKQILLFLTLALLFSCNKERSPQIRYEVSCNSACEVDFSMNGGLVTTESVSGSWGKTFRGNPGSQVYLRVVLTAPNGSFSAKVLIDDEEFDSVSSDISYEPQTISGIIPG